MLLAASEQDESWSDRDTCAKVGLSCDRHPEGNQQLRTGTFYISFLRHRQLSYKDAYGRSATTISATTLSATMPSPRTELHERQCQNSAVNSMHPPQ